MPVVQIIAPQSVRFSHDNGFTLKQYEPGELYEVPDFVARGMFERGWAKGVSVADLQHPQHPQPAITEPPPPPQPVEDNGNNSGNGDDNDHDKSAIPPQNRRRR